MIYRFDTDTMDWVTLETQYDSVAATVQAEAESVGFFVMGVPKDPPWKLPPPEISCRMIEGAAGSSPESLYGMAIYILPLAGVLLLKRLRRR